MASDEGRYYTQIGSFLHAPDRKFLLLPHREYSPGLFRECTGWVAFDHTGPKPGTNILCFEISTTETVVDDDEGVYLKRDHDILVLQSTGETDEYRRVGIGAIRMGIDGGKDMTYEAAPKYHTSEDMDYFTGLDPTLIWMV